MGKPHQRKGAKSNTQVGKEFERAAKDFFATKKRLCLQNDIPVDVGINGKKQHKFDLGNINKKILVECKSHTWTESNYVPSAKMTTWDQAMYLFYATPRGFRKIFFVLKDYSPKKQETLAEYYIRTKSHLIPKDVEIWEFDESTKEGTRLR
jgi:hypothetical protein